MIGRLRGTILEKLSPGFLLLEVHGTGYEIELPASAFTNLPETDREAVVYVHMIVREDARLLYGFIERAERDLFRELIRVSGIGPKLAIAILSSMGAEGLHRCLGENNVQMLTGVPGVGKKTAGRLMVELQGIADSKMIFPARLSAKVAPSVLPESASGAAGDAINALIALGYKQNDASRAVLSVSVDHGRELRSDELVRKALQSISAARL